ncbi:MAG: zinc metalloprotease HtpX [bacterium]
MNTVKTAMLMGALVGVFMLFGQVLGGQSGMIIALVIAGGMNFFMYWFSDTIVLKRYGAEEIPEEEAPQLHRVVGRLAEKAGIPKPDVYRIPEAQPNAFATGRNPANAAIAVTDGIMDMLSEDELEGVLAHELSHVMNRDTLISTLAATMAGAISYLAFFARLGALFGIGGRNRDGNLLVLLVSAILAPIIAAVIQMAISRSREFKADKSGAEISGKPMALAGALKKLHQSAEARPMQNADKQTANLFIVNPLSMDSVSSWFSTHPSVEDRVDQLEKIARGL